MSNVVSMSGVGDDDRAVQASGWIARLDRGLNTSERAELEAWLMASPDNEAELLAMAELWDRIDVLSCLAEIFPHPVPFAARPHHRVRIATLGTAVAVILVAAAVLIARSPSLSAPDMPATTVETATYETAVGGLSRVELADGSRITLNTDSRADIRFGDHQRVIHLERGEIHVDVAHDPLRPLMVYAGGRFVQAVGTAFSVKIDQSQRVEILVTDGRVRVGVQAANASGNSSETRARPDSRDRIVERNERILLDADNASIDVVEPEEIEVELSWRDGNLVFRGESLAEAAAEVGRYTTVEFLILGDDLRNTRVAGRFKAGDVSGFLANLKANFNVVYKRVDERTIQVSLPEGAADRPAP